jgi:2-polyprenyl-3-methyl-5-hydroxy-6-metoxy-1,4-benzoquinol methylase
MGIRFDIKTFFTDLIAIFKNDSTNASFFELMYRCKKDPWNYSSSDYEKRKYKETLEAVSGKRFERILEVGCAEGVFTHMLAPYGEEVLAVDISKTALERAKCRNRSNKNVGFDCLNIENDRLNGKFDLILCSEILYYLDTQERIEKVRDKLTEHLKPGGYFLLTHMRLLKEDESGHPTPVTGLPRIGAKTVHGVFRQSEKLKVIYENIKSLYVITLLEKINK